MTPTAADPALHCPPPSGPHQERYASLRDGLRPLLTRPLRQAPLLRYRVGGSVWSTERAPWPRRSVQIALSGDRPHLHSQRGGLQTTQRVGPLANTRGVGCCHMGWRECGPLGAWSCLSLVPGGTAPTRNPCRQHRAVAHTLPLAPSANRSRRRPLASRHELWRGRRRLKIEPPRNRLAKDTHQDTVPSSGAETSTATPLQVSTPSGPKSSRPQHKWGFRALWVRAPRGPQTCCVASPDA